MFDKNFELLDTIFNLLDKKDATTTKTQLSQ